MLGNEDTAAPTTPPQNGASREVVEEARGQDSSGESALWVKLLDPIAKLPTNVGSRIRNRVIDALAANPPAWAAEMLTYSISKKVYKGNASGPTKVSLGVAACRAKSIEVCTHHAFTFFYPGCLPDGIWCKRDVYGCLGARGLSLQSSLILFVLIRGGRKCLALYKIIQVWR